MSDYLSNSFSTTLPLPNPSDPTFQAVDAVKEILGFARDIVVAKEIEETKREAIRAHAEIAIAQIKANNSVELARIMSSHYERMRMIDLVEKALMKSDIEKYPEFVTTLAELLKSARVGE